LLNTFSKRRGIVNSAVSASAHFGKGFYFLVAPFIYVVALKFCIESMDASFEQSIA